MPNRNDPGLRNLVIGSLAGVAPSRLLPRSLHDILAWLLPANLGNKLSGRDTATRTTAIRKGKPECGDDLRLLIVATRYVWQPKLATLD